MPYMQWTPAMSVGLTELDDDHKTLIRIINQIAETAEDAERQDVVRQCLLALMRYAETHFGREESVMRACKYPQLQGHSQEHRDFIQRIQDIATRFEDDPEGLVTLVSDELLEFLKNWLSHHILIEDMAYRPIVEQQLMNARRAAQEFRGAEIWRSA